MGGVWKLCSRTHFMEQAIPRCLGVAASQPRVDAIAISIACSTIFQYDVMIITSLFDAEGVHGLHSYILKETGTFDCLPRRDSCDQ